MATRKTAQPLIAGPLLWGPRRARLGISLRALEELSGIARGDLSRMERGRMFPTGEEYDKVTAALDALRVEKEREP